MVWRGNEGIPGSSEAIGKLSSMGETVFFVTNNSLLTTSQYVKKMDAFGIDVNESQIYTSSMAAASLVEESEKVYLIGGDGIRQALEDRNVEIVDGNGEVDAVVLGWDHEIDFDKITKAMTAIRGGARYIATNSDPTYPSPGKLLPGTGSLAAAVATASGIAPLVAGKPNQAIAELIKPLISLDDVMVGDRISTDGEFARVLGVHFGLVLTGVTEEEGKFDLSKSTTICNDLQCMVSLYEEQGHLPNGDFSTTTFER